MTSITNEAAELLTEAASASSGRASRTLVGGTGHALRQTLIALVGGQQLDEHENPGEATVHVVLGRVELHSGDELQHGDAGDLLVVPDARHGLRALADSVVLLTVAMRS